MLNTGELDRRIAIQRATSTQDAAGEVVATWEQIGRLRWARLLPLDSTERFISEQFVAREQVEFLVRWATDISNVSPLDRIIYPVTETLMDSEIYDVLARYEVGWREGLRILAARRSEVAAV